MSTILLRLVLALVGGVIIWLGLNVGLGGIPTLGWQGPTDFVAITDQTAFSVQDNHVRFLGGFWLGAGLVMMLGAVFLQALNSTLMTLLAMVFVGGLARLSVSDAGLIFSAQILPSLFAELVVFPLLAYWIFCTRKEPAND